MDTNSQAATAESGRASNHKADYHAMDELYRTTWREVQSAGSDMVQSRRRRDRLNHMQDLMESSRRHRDAAASSLLQLESASVYATPEIAVRLTAHIRLSQQLAVRALMALAHIGRSGRHLNHVLPRARGHLLIDSARDGNLDEMSATHLFGSTHATHLGPRPRQTALNDLALNLLAQRTRDWQFTERHCRAFVRDFLVHAKPGDIIDEDQVNAWINRRRVGEVSDPTPEGQPLTAAGSNVR